MAYTQRSIPEIEDLIQAEKASYANLNTLQPSIDSHQTLLSDLQSPSKVADWRIIRYIMALASWTLEGLWVAFRTEVDAKISAQQAGTPLWYRDELLKFQYGDTKTWVNRKWVYPILDVTKQIIVRCAAVVPENGDDAGKLILKTAKDVAGTLSAMSAPELVAAREYVKRWHFAGVPYKIISLPPDFLKLSYDIYYDPLVPLATVQTNVEGAIENHLEKFNNPLYFGGEFVLTFLTDALQDAEGVRNPVLISADGKPDTGAYTPFATSYLSEAGYLIIDPAAPIATQFNWIADV